MRQCSIGAKSSVGKHSRRIGLGAIEVTTDAGGSSWAGIFTSTGSGGGVRITTNGGPGLQVTGGTKNAVVHTSNGARALYTEESTEVWFTDYAFGRLTSGRAHVAIDPTFAETVKLASREGDSWGCRHRRRSGGGPRSASHGRDGRRVW